MQSLFILWKSFSKFGEKGNVFHLFFSGKVLKKTFNVINTIKHAVINGFQVNLPMNQGKNITVASNT